RFHRLTDTLARLTVFRVDAPAPAVSWARAHFLSTPETPLAASSLASVERDGVELAPDLTAPTLVLHGDRDKQVTDKDVRRLMDALPDAELTTVEGAGHMLLLTHPGVVAQHIERWVRAVGRS
ncbi:alpha/beta hydrolase, partial [Georgenia sp. 10Sc9-8]|nr:alpha/beta hydrolase [Georgenia halotolerans]